MMQAWSDYLMYPPAEFYRPELRLAESQGVLVDEVTEEGVWVSEVNKEGMR